MYQLKALTVWKPVSSHGYGTAAPSLDDLAKKMSQHSSILLTGRDQYQPLLAESI
uniref:Uncharacterized protein n=1 Tax=Arundo donax TaxID=35708 RepID=A0A0A9FZE9_ARUDO